MLRLDLLVFLLHVNSVMFFGHFEIPLCSLYIVIVFRIVLPCKISDTSINIFTPMFFFYPGEEEGPDSDDEEEEDDNDVSLLKACHHITC